MQSVSAAFTAEERDRVRKIAHNLLVSWKKETNVGVRTFTIGVSTIGGKHVIGINPGAVGGPGIYSYFDDSAYVKSLAWERGLNIPLGGLTKAMAEADLDNTSGRYLPDYMGGRSELFTAVLPRRPFIINAGFNFSGIDQVIPQFAGVTSGIPTIDNRSKDTRIKGYDYVDFFQNRYLDESVMYTGITTDVVIENLFLQLGMSTAQYSLDEGLNTIPFSVFDKGAKFSDVMHKLAEAENGHLFQDEQGIFRFWNRLHFSSAPYTQVQRVLLTSQVLESGAPSEGNLINTVEVKSQRYAKQPSEQVFKLSAPVALAGSGDTELFVNFDSAILQLDTISFYVANVASDESGTDITSSVTVRRVDTFAKAAKVTFTNSTSAGYLTQLSIYGRTAKPISDIYVRLRDDSSVTAYEEQPIVVDNPYIQDSTWANSLAQLLLSQYSTPDKLQTLTIRAIPELQFGDLISWQGMDWRVYSIRAKLSPSEGFVQEIVISQAASVTYFTIGVSTIGGTDRIAP